MTTASNLLLLLIPESLFGPLLLSLFIVGGLAIIMGFQRHGVALIISAITIPLASVFVEALMNALFGMLPAWLVIPVSIALQLVIYVIVGLGLINLIFGQKAIDEAKGHLLADLIRWMFRKIFSRTGLLVFGIFILFLYLRVAL